MTVNLEPGREVDVYLPGKTKAKRARVVRIESNGDVTVADPRNGGLRTIHPDRVKSVHYKEKLRK